jgi:hypothetical protein
VAWVAPPVAVTVVVTGVVVVVVTVTDGSVVYCSNWTVRPSASVTVAVAGAPL